MYQEIDRPFDVSFAPREASPDDLAVCLRDDRLLLAERDGAIVFPRVRDAARADTYLFTVGDTRYFLCSAEPFGDFAYQDPGRIRAAKPGAAVFAGITGLHLARWYRDNRFCGRCGRPTRHSETERALVCDCGYTVYPRINPAVIVAVVRGGRILLTKYNRPGAKWALVAGFCEIGETPEQTAAREVREETGLTVTDARYCGSQPWGLSGSVLMGFVCHAAEDGEPVPDHDELKEARWFAPEQIDFTDDGVSLTRDMIERFRTGALA